MTPIIKPSNFSSVSTQSEKICRDSVESTETLTKTVALLVVEANCVFNNKM